MYCTSSANVYNDVNSVSITPQHLFQAPSRSPPVLLALQVLQGLQEQLLLPLKSSSTFPATLVRVSGVFGAKKRCGATGVCEHIVFVHSARSRLVGSPGPPGPPGPPGVPGTFSGSLEDISTRIIAYIQRKTSWLPCCWFAAVIVRHH